MATKKKKKRSAKPMKVVSLASALHMVRQAEHRIAARGYPRKNPDNPLRHFPKLKGRGRPQKKKLFEMVTRLANGMVAEKKFRATRQEAHAMANRILKRKFEGSPVVEIMLEDK